MVTKVHLHLNVEFKVQALYPLLTEKKSVCEGLCHEVTL